MKKEFENYIIEQENIKYFSILEYLKKYEINRSVLTNKKWANPIFLKYKKVLSIKGKKSRSKCTVLPYHIGMVFLLTIKTKNEELLEMQENILLKIKF